MSLRTPRADRSALEPVLNGPARLAAGCLSAALLVAAFPPWRVGVLAWVALVPLILAIQGLSAWRGFALGWLCGVIANFGVFYWIFEVPGFHLRHALVLAPILGLFLAVWCVGVVQLRFPSLVSILGLAALWSLLEWARAHAGFLALPWANLAHTQTRNTWFLQLAAVGGEGAIAFMLVVVNGLVALAIARGDRRRILEALVLLVVLESAGLGLTKWPRAGTDALRVAVIQPAIARGERSTPAGYVAGRTRIANLTRAAASAHPDLIVWPETAIREISTRPEEGRFVAALAGEAGSAILTGASEAEKFARRERASLTAGMRVYNSAYLVSSTGDLSPPYRKVKLLPFAESTPMADSVHWPEWLVGKSFGITPGTKPILFSLGRGIEILPIICWENLFADFVRSGVDRGADLVVHLANDNWFGRTAAPYQHLRASQLRAVENGVSVVAASNTGPSELIDPRGRIIRRFDRPFTAGWIEADVPIDRVPTLFSRCGNWIPGLWITLFAACAVLSRRRRSLSSVPQTQASESE